jgi:hypothetical protein
VRTPPYRTALGGPAARAPRGGWRLPYTP